MLKFKSISELEFPQLISAIIVEYAHQILIHGIETDQSIATNISQTAVNSILPNGFNSPNNYFTLIYHNNNRIGYIWYLMKDKQTAVIGMIFIDTAYRKKGFGHQIIKQLEKVFKDHKLSKIILGVFKENKIALSLYVKHGYKIEKLVAIQPEYPPHKYMMYKNLDLTY